MAAKRTAPSPVSPTVTPVVPEPAVAKSAGTPGRAVYFNRELSWLAFNRRVLAQAQGERHPLLERVRFLAIFSSNLDEFFEIRVAGLMQQADDGGAGEGGPDGLGAREQLRLIHAEVAGLIAEQYQCWHRQLMPALARQGLVVKAAKELTAAELGWVESYFREQVYPVLTPLALDAAHPFPQLGNKTLNIVVSLGEPGADAAAGGEVALLPVPRILPRLVQIEPQAAGRRRFVFLTEIIKLCAGALFPGYHVAGAHVFRVTRNSDLYLDEEEAENLLKRIEDELRNRRRGAAVRLEIEDGVSAAIFTSLCEHLGLSQEYVFRLGGPLNLLRVQSLCDLDRPDLKFPPFVPAAVSPLREPARIFEALCAGDVLLHHPYDSFQPVVDFVEQAARDPQVFALKQTLYRTSGDSPIVRALMEASRNGKQVTALVELKARFDEANNIQWAKQLEEAGVHVVYGLVGHKTHCKCSLVVRREERGLRRYVHLGTGNYNPRTARLYTDLSLFTAREDLTSDVAQLFNTLTGYNRAPVFRRLLVAPFNLHARLLSLIAREAENAAAGHPARIMAKMNALVDKAVIDALYAASQAGVTVELIVRGTCCLVPGVRGLSERIRVRSVVGRFLEHARTFYFENHGGDGGPLIYAGSADWMPRNFFRRIEVVFPVDDPALRRWMTAEFFAHELQDTANARELHPNGSYQPVARADAPSFSAQNYFIAAAQQRAAQVAAEL